MTSEEFDKYLKSIGGLENGYTPYPNKYSYKFKHRAFIICKKLGIPDRKNPFRSRIYKSGFFSVGDGWLELIKNCIDECIQAGWNKEICQGKEKFGGLRFYINGSSDKVHDIISKYENLSYEVCERCGTKENVIQTKGWITTICHPCLDKVEQSKKAQL